MLIKDWLNSVYSRLNSSVRHTARRRTHLRNVSGRPALIEMLEPRQLMSAAAIGFETQVNTFNQNSQGGVAVAIDAAGESVAVWSSLTQDGSGSGIYAQRYSAQGVAQGNEFHVNTFTTGAQDAPAVAMDAVGNFTVTWNSAGQDGSGTGIYAQRFNSHGVALGSEFKVNTYTTGKQASPSIAMDAAGAFVISWDSSAQDGSGFGVYAKRFSTAGVVQGSEFRVNTWTTADQRSSSVAMDGAGNFVVGWVSAFQDGSGYGVYGQRFNSAGVAQGAEFRANTFTTGNQSAVAIAMDATGDFVMTWHSGTQDSGGYGVYAQRYKSAGVAVGSEFKVNTFTTGTQDGPAVSMDAAGDFVVTWDSQNQDGSQYGVYAQQYLANGQSDGPEFRVNTFTIGHQSGSAVAMNAGGDFIAAWQSVSEDGNSDGVFAQRYVATVGPIVTAVLDGTRVIHDGERLISGATPLVVDFSSDLNAVVGGANSVVNPANWRLSRYGVDVSNQIQQITFGYDPVTNRYAATMAFNQPLTEGGYQLTARQTIMDLAGRPLDGEANKIPGGDFHRSFAVAQTFVPGPVARVNTSVVNDQKFSAIATDAQGDSVVAWSSIGQDGSSYGVYAQRYNASGAPLGAEFAVNTWTTSIQNHPAVAMDDAGDFVICWTSNLQDGDGYSIYAQRYNSAGMAQGTEFHVNSYTTNDQQNARVAMDALGNFVVTWQSTDTQDSYGIYAQRYDANGIKLGSEFRVNSYKTGDQEAPSIAIDSAGDFVITWESFGQDGDRSGIFGRQFNSLGIAQGTEFRVNSYTPGDQQSPSVAMDGHADFVVVWSTAVEDGDGFGIVGQRFDHNGSPLGQEFQINTFTTGNQVNPAAAMDLAGDFVVTWTSQKQNNTYAGIYGQRFNSGGTPQGSEFRVNSFTKSDQKYSAVAMDSKGDFVSSWSSLAQDFGFSYGVYSQRYQTDVAPLLSQIEPAALSAPGPANTPVTSSLLVSDQDSANLTGATVQISTNYLNGQDVLGFVNTATITASWNAANGTLTLSGTDTVANYRAALRNVTYHNLSNSPNTALTRTLDFQTTDVMLSSNVVSRDLTVVASAAPVVTGTGGVVTYVENAVAVQIAANLVVSDPDSANLASATISFTNWQAEDRVNFVNSFALQHQFTQDLATHTATLTITGTETLDHYQILLRSVVYWDVSDNPVATNRVASFVVNDGVANSNAALQSIAVTAVNDSPLVSALEATPLACKANDPAFPPQTISSTLLVSDPDSTSLTKATIQITSGYQNNAGGHDLLSFTNQLGIAGSFNAVTGTLTLSGLSSVSNYRTALRSVSFSSSGSNVSAADRILTIVATDDSGSPTANSLPVTRTVTVTTTNTPPALTGIPATALTYVRGAAAALVAPNAIVLDSDSINLTGATIQITANYQIGQDILAVTNGQGITGSFNSATGILTLTGTASLASYQSVLRSVTYKTLNNLASTATRTISFVVNDGLATSSAVARTVTLT